MSGSPTDTAGDLEAWVPPPGWDVGRPSDTDPLGLRYPRLDDDEVRSLCDHLRRARKDHLARRPAGELARRIGEVGARFLREGDPAREDALARLPKSAGMSPEMARVVLDGMARDWTGPRLEALLSAEFEDPAVLDGFRAGYAGVRVRATGPSLSLHVCAGTVPGVSVTSMIRALLVKSAVVVKPGRGDVVLPVLFARALREEDPEIAGCLAVLYWPGGEGEGEAAFLDEADTVVAYGANETIRSLEHRLPLTKELVAYRHRLSAGMVGREGLKAAADARRIAERAALSVATFDRRGCVSPHLFYVESGGELDPGSWADALAEAMERLESALPSGQLSSAEASELQQLRGNTELRAASGEAVRIRHGGVASWTVILDPEPEFRPSCPGRVIRVVPVDDLRDGVQEIARLGGHLQTISVDGVGARRESLAEALARAGVSRVTTASDAPWPPPWWHHDGAGPLRALVRWVDLEGEAGA